MVGGLARERSSTGLPDPSTIGGVRIPHKRDDIDMWTTCEPWTVHPPGCRPGHADATGPSGLTCATQKTCCAHANNDGRPRWDPAEFKDQPEREMNQSSAGLGRRAFLSGALASVGGLALTGRGDAQTGPV